MKEVVKKTQKKNIDKLKIYLSEVKEQKNISLREKIIFILNGRSN
jgi:hypothetical protein